MRPLRTRLSLLSLALTLLAAPATAQPAPDDRAAVHFQAGASYYQAHDYEAALREFERAYALSGEPALLYNMHVCHRELGHREAAIHFLEEYLTHTPQAAQREELERQLEALRLEVLREREMAIGDATHPADPVDLPAEPEPESVGDTPAPDDTTAPVRTEFRMPIGAIVTLAVGGASLAVFAGFGVAALEEDDRLDRACARGCQPEELDHLRTLMIVADTTLALSGALLVAGLIWTLVDGEQPVAAAGDARVSPWVGDRAAGWILDAAF